MNAQEIHTSRPPAGATSELRAIARSGFDLTALPPGDHPPESTDISEIVGYRIVFQSSPVGLLVTSESGTILDASESALRLLDLERTAVVGRTSEAIGLLPLRWHDHVFDSTDAYGPARQVESRITLRSGEEREVLLSVAPLPAGLGAKSARFVTAVVDVTGRREAYERKAHSDRLASMATLGAGVAHHIDNPLTCIVTCLDLLDEQVCGPEVSEHEARERIEDLVDGAREGAQRVASIVRRMRMLARADARRSEAVDLSRVLETAIDATSEELRSRARVVMDCKSAPRVQADEGSLVQIFVDILLNAARALPIGGFDHHEVHVGLSIEGDRAVVVIHDTGSGIGVETQRRVFDPFFFEGPPATSVGLGLSICDRVLTGLGGAIAIESQEGEGTTVRVMIPTCPPGKRPGDAAG